MTLMETAQLLGNFGAFVGAIAVVGTLVYLAIQVRHSQEAMRANTQSLDEGRRLALAQAYQNRTMMLLDNLRDMRESPHVLLFSIGAAENDENEDETRARVWLRWWANYLDNIYYQYQQHFIDDEYYQHQFVTSIKVFAPHWRGAGITEPRPSFTQEVERILETSR